ncbi:MAG: hypothetical protein IPJ40_06855 [Saprospirales bacterium]|nr:hypothetical protein [Saprospirales bacterium]
MKITTLFLLFFCCTASVLLAQDPVTNRVQIHQDQTTLEANKLQVQDLEEKRLRLAEAISDGDIESADIMKQEVLQLMDLQVEEGVHWIAENGNALTDPQLLNQFISSIDRMKTLRENLGRFPIDNAGMEHAREAGNLVSEFVALMGRVPF